MDYQLENYRQEGFILCLSGGVDSSTMLKLIVDQYGPCKVVGFTTVLDEFSNALDISDANELCAQLGVKHIIKNITPVFLAFREVTPELVTQPIDNIASRVRVGMVCEFAVKYNLRLVFAAPLSEWVFSGIPIGCDVAHCYPFAGLYKAEILAIAQDIGLPSKFLSKKPSNSAIDEKKFDKTKQFGLSLSTIDKIIAYLNGVIERESIADIDDKTLMRFDFLFRYFEGDIDIRGLSSCCESNTSKRKEFLLRIDMFPFEN